MEAYETEEQQVAAIKEWWKNNFKQVVAVFILGIAAILGYQNYQQNKQITMEAASNHFVEVLKGAENKQTDLIIGRTDILKQEHDSSPYAAMAALLKAKAFVDEKKYTQAVDELMWAENNSNDASLVQVAFIRRIKLLIQIGKSEQALTQLNGQISTNEKESTEKDSNSFSPILFETKGDILSMLNKRDEAKKAYDEALSGFLLVGVSTDLLQIKRNDLGE